MTTFWIDESRQYFARPRWRSAQHLLTVLGLAAADGASFLLAHFLFRYGHNVPSLMFFFGVTRHSSVTINLFTILSMAFIAVRYLSGDYSRRQLFWDGCKVITIALVVTSLPDFAMVALGAGLYALMPVLLCWLFLLFAVPVLRQCARSVMARLGIWGIPTAIIGAGTRTTEIYRTLRCSLALGFETRWLIIGNGAPPPPPELSPLTLIRCDDATSLAATIHCLGCEEAIITEESAQSEQLADIARRLLEVNMPVAIIPSLKRLPLANVSTNYFFGRDILLMQVRSNVQRRPWRFVKRSFDIIVSVISLILLTPLFLALAIAIKLDTAGPVTYTQRRVGRHGVQFDCLKLRTMRPDADVILERWKTDNPHLYKEFQTSFKLKDDPRITRLGKWLRRTSVDELPQLINVLRGDMSLVGPRPIPEQQLRDQYGSAAQLYMRVRPGISGLWQISGRSETTSDERVILDEWYILNWSFWYDIVILIQTVWIVLARKGAY